MENLDSKEVNINDSEGNLILLGQKDSALSLPIVIASDQSPIPVSGTITVGSPLPAGTNIVGSVIPAVTTTGGLSIYRNLNLGTTGVNIKNTAGQIYSWIICNNATSARFLKIYNKATAPSVGTDTPVMTIEMPPSSTGQYSLTFGIAFSLGIGVGATQLVADGDTTAPNTNDVVVNILYN